MDLELTSKVAVVTGGATGIGKEIARQLLKEGATVVILSRNADNLAAACAELAPLGRIASRPCDVTDFPGFQARLREIAAEFGSLDVLVNNAGDAVPGLIPDLTMEQWHHYFRLMVDAPFAALQAVMPIMQAQGGGSIVMISAITAARASPGLAAHGTPRAALQQLSSIAAIEGGPHNIRVNALQVGAVATERSVEWMAQAPGLEEKVNATIPLRRQATPEEVAATTVFLASPRSGFTTGAVIALDGGASAAFVGS